MTYDEILKNSTPMPAATTPEESLESLSRTIDETFDRFATRHQQDQSIIEALVEALNKAVLYCGVRGPLSHEIRRKIVEQGNAALALARGEKAENAAYIVELIGKKWFWRIK